MFRKILLPVDGSHFSELALPLAVRISKAAGASLHIVRVHVGAPTTVQPSPEWDLDEAVREKEREQLSTAAARASINGVAATTELLEGPVAAGLERYIGVIGIDLVIMATHGRSGIKRAVLGSIAEHCVRHTHTPILLIHAASEDDTAAVGSSTTLKRIIVALDGSVESEQMLAPALALAQVSHARVTLVRVASAPFDIAVAIGAEALRLYLDDARKEAEAYLHAVADRLPQTAGVDVFAITADRAADGILRACDELRADAVAMATHGRSGWSRIAVGSVAESVLRKATVPVLVLRPAAVGAEQTPTVH